MNEQNQKLYVGNLNYDANEDQVRELFGTFGEVADVKIVMDRFTGRSRGFAFVRYDSAESAGKAKEGLNGQPFLGKTLVIDWARAEPKERTPGDRPPMGGGGFRERREGGGGGGEHRGGFRGERRGGGGGGGDRFDRGNRSDRGGGFYGR